MFCYFHFVIKTRASCRPKSRCQSDLSTVSALANKNLHQDLMHSGCHGTTVPSVCLQAFSLFPLPSSPLNQRPVHRLHNRHFTSQARRIRHFKRSVIARADEKIKCLLPIHCSGSSHVHYMNDTLQLGNFNDTWFWRNSGMFVWNKTLKTAVAQSYSFDNAVREALHLFPNVPEIMEKQNKRFILLLKRKDVFGFIPTT